MADENDDVMADENDERDERDDEGASDGDESAAALASATVADDSTSTPEGSSELEMAPLASMLGLERWIQFSFLGAAIAAFFLVDQLTTFVLDQFAIAFPASAVSGIAAFVALLGSFAAYRHPATNTWATEVVTELSLVTWPTRDETYTSTVVVIVTSVVAALYTGIFDALWSAFTDLVYKV